MNSPLVDKTIYSPNHSGKRTHKIDRITPHCVVGQCSIEVLGAIFEKKSRKASANYGIGKDGRVGLFVDECNRSWCSSSNANDQRAVTIECASDTTFPYAFNSTVWNKLIELCVDICKRNGKSKLLYISDKTKALAYEPKNDEMLITLHKWFAATACPGDWCIGKLKELADTVTKKLSNDSTNNSNTDSTTNKYYRVQVGAYEDKENAKRMSERLIVDKYLNIIKYVNGLYKVQTGAFTKKENALKMQEELKAKGYPTYVTLD